jgi:hypothetical protein
MSQLVENQALLLRIDAAAYHRVRWHSLRIGLAMLGDFRNV